MAKRYEIVTNGGVLATKPPLAVVYLDGSFPTPTSHPTKQVAQKDLAFLPPLLPVQVGTTVEFPEPGRHLPQHFLLLTRQTIRSRPLSSRRTANSFGGF